MVKRIRVILAGASLVALAAGCSGNFGTQGGARSITTATASGTESRSSTPSAPVPSSTTAGRDGVPRYTHIVLVVEENHSYGSVVSDPNANYLNSLANAGVRLTNFYAITHPSQPNYVSLFAGAPAGVTNDSCPQRLSGPNLARELIQARRNFIGYSEGLPHVGYRGCTVGAYARRHAPWTDYQLPATTNQPFSAFPHAYRRLPTMSVVIPNLQHDMHDGTVGQADRWLQMNLATYAAWSISHNSLLVITFDEGADHSANHVLTVLYGAHVQPGTDGTRFTHYSLLRLIEDAFNVPRLGRSATAPSITADWQP